MHSYFYLFFSNSFKELAEIADNSSETSNIFF